MRQIKFLKRARSKLKELRHDRDCEGSSCSNSDEKQSSVNTIPLRPSPVDQKESMMTASPECREGDARTEARASIYLAAALYCDGFPAPVRIRNLSTTGALVEGATVPNSGALVQLVRGGLIVHGLVAWSADGRCGLKFSGSIDVQRWRVAPNLEQQRVDEVVRLVKAGAVPLPVPPLGQAPQRPEPAEWGTRLSQDLHSASELLEKLGEALAGDAHVVAAHGPALQNLDIALQVLAAVEAILDGDESADMDATKLRALRRSATQALQLSMKA